MHSLYALLCKDAIKENSPYESMLFLCNEKIQLNPKLLK